MQKRRQTLAVDELVGQGVVAEYIDGYGQHFAFEARGSPVDDDIEMLTGEIVITAAPHVAARRVIAGQRAGFRRRTIGNHQYVRLLLDEWQQRAAHGAARAHQQNAPSTHRTSEIFLDIVDEPDAIEVLGVNSMAVELQCIDRAREPRTLAQVGRHLACIELEWSGDIESAAPFGAELLGDPPEAVERRLELRIFDVLPGFLRERCVNQRRLRMHHRIADHRIAISHAVSIPLSKSGGCLIGRRHCCAQREQVAVDAESGNRSANDLREHRQMPEFFARMHVRHVAFDNRHVEDRERIA